MMKKIIVAFFTLAMITGFTSCAQQTSRVKTEEVSNKDLSKYSTAAFASGCFWHTELLFEDMVGVAEAVSGYAGGDMANPTYEDVTSGNTGHAESVMVYYDSTKVSYATLLKAYFEAQDPTSVNGQGYDRGTQYRSIAFYTNNDQKSAIENYIKQLNDSKRYKDPIAVQVVPLDKFYTAEAYHQEYAKNHPNEPYVKNVCTKEVKHFQKKFPELIKPGHMID
jgi:peptide-methionine (S)-S-oxide reductase